MCFLIRKYIISVLSKLCGASCPRIFGVESKNDEESTWFAEGTRGWHSERESGWGEAERLWASASREAVPALPPLPSPPPAPHGEAQLRSLLLSTPRCPGWVSSSNVVGAALHLEPPLGSARSDLLPVPCPGEHGTSFLFPLLEHTLEPTIRSHKVSYLYPVMLFF